MVEWMASTDGRTTPRAGRVCNRRAGASLVVVLVIGVALAATPPAGGADLPPGGTFVDDDGSVHEGAIEAIAAAGITQGCRDAHFCVDRLLTRAEMAAFLARALNLPAAGTDFFADDTNHLFEAEINQLAAAGITQGCETGQFCPDETMSRGQMASFLARAFSLPAGTDDVSRFSVDRPAEETVSTPPR